MTILMNEWRPRSFFSDWAGIQQYLFENGRIDNIFTDMYYEKFTECLNELLIPYQPKVNSAGKDCQKSGISIEEHVNAMYMCKDNRK